MSSFTSCCCNPVLLLFPPHQYLFGCSICFYNWQSSCARSYTIRIAMYHKPHSNPAHPLSSFLSPLKSLHLFQFCVQELKYMYFLLDFPCLQLLEISAVDLISKGNSYISSCQHAASNLLKLNKVFKVRLGRGFYGECLVNIITIFQLIVLMVLALHYYQQFNFMMGVQTNSQVELTT